MEFIKNLLATSERNYEEKDNFFFTAQLGDYNSTIQHDVEDDTWGALRPDGDLWFCSMESAIREEVNAALRHHAADIVNLPFACYDSEGDEAEWRLYFRETIENMFMRTAFVVCANEEDARLLERLLEAFDYGKVEHEPDTPADCPRVYYWHEGRGKWVEADAYNPMAKFIIKNCRQ